MPVLSRQCKNGFVVVKYVPQSGERVVATVDGCSYVAYTVYACAATPAPTASVHR